MTTFGHLLAEAFRESPDHLCVVLQRAGQPDLTLTFRQVMEGANSYALVLKNMGVLPGDVVVIILEHSQALLFAYWGTIMHGAIPSVMPFLTEKLAPERYRNELVALLDVTRPSAIITYPEFETEVRAAIESCGADSHRNNRKPSEPGRMSIAVLLPDHIPPPSTPDFETLPAVGRHPDDLVLLQHSSGTTGLQKGVALTHRAVIKQLSVYAKAIQLNPDSDVIVSWLPLYHDMGLIACFILPILLRVPLVLMSPFDWVRAPYRLMQSVSQYRGTLTWLPNFAFNLCARTVRPRQMEGVDLNSWRAVINCSEPVRAESHAAFYTAFSSYGLRPAVLHTSYAMAENVFAVTQSPLDRSPAIIAVDPVAFISERNVRPPKSPNAGLSLLSSGQVLENAKLCVLDEKRRPVIDGIVGELALRSDCMLNEYYNRPEASKLAFKTGWYLTGDYGFMLDGEVFVTGRKKDLIIVGGKNIYPQDLEALASEVPGVHPGRVAAFGIYNDDTGTEDVVIVAEADGQTLQSWEEIADAVRAYVTKNSAIALRKVEIVEPRWILKTSSGKVNRAANREKYLQKSHSY